MATQDKLQKSLEILKNLNNSNQIYDVSRKKDKVYHCHVITEAISNPTIQVASNFQYFLSLTIETLLKLCDDQESDIRMTSEECLNKIIRAANNLNTWKIQLELHKEIQRNGPARSLRAALWRFGQIAHLIRPLKGKTYVDKLFPNLCKVIERQEEQIHDTLASSIPNIMKSLGSFSSDSEVKAILAAFLSNINHPQSAVIRRTSATSVLNVCLNCRKPQKFITYCFHNILDLLTPVSENFNYTSILGSMNAIKVLLPYLDLKSNYESYSDTQYKKRDGNVSVEKLLQVYELCLFYLSNKDHNIVNASLETLNVLLQNCNSELKDVLLSKNGPGRSRIYCSQASSLMKLKSPSQLSVATNLTSGEDNLFEESELTETLNSDIEKWIDQSKLSVMNITYAKTKDNFEKSLSVDTASNISDVTDDVDYGNLNKPSENYSSMMESLSIGDNLDRLSLSENSSEKSSFIEEKILNTDSEVFNVDIGDYLDKDESILYCAKLISKNFLLTGSPGGLVSDRVSRVSVKSLALTCMSTIVKLQPNILLKYLDKNCLSSKISNTNISHQEMSDILLFADHSDPQLRGIVRMLVSNFIKAILLENNRNFYEWITANICVENTTVVQMEKLVLILTKGLEDDSANCTRQTITSLGVVLSHILESEECKTVIPLLQVLPSLSKNPYWLVKVALCELVSKLSYVTVCYVLEESTFQSKIIHNVLFELLSDNDQRVRSAAASSIVEVIPNLYNEQFHTKESITTTKAMHYKNMYLSNLRDSEKDTNLNRKHFIETMPFPYDNITGKCCDSAEFTLSKIVNKLYKFILSSTSKYFILGCLETLCLLSIKYPSTVYMKAWVLPCCSIGESSSNTEKATPDLLSLCISLLNNSIIVYDVKCHINLLELTANLFAGQSVALLRPITDVENTTRLWDMFESNSYTNKCEIYLTHIVKLLNIFHHVINDMMPISSQSKPVLPSLPSASNLSPIKRRKSDLDKRMINSGKLSEKEEKPEKNAKFNSITSFAHLPHYLKIYDVLKSSYSNYKVSLDSNTCERFLEIMRKLLSTLSILMEVGTLTEFGRISDELLTYLRSTFLLDPISTVASVQQMLKCLFSTNLTANVTEILEPKRKEEELSEEHNGFYYHLAQMPYNEISSCINSLNTINKIECDRDDTLMGYLHRKDVKKTTILSRSNDKTLANYIRIFEPMVIKSLKQYTVTSDVKLQSQVLQLLSQLVQLRVNYCLLDSEQVFIGFVLKQFEYIEEGQIPFTDELIPKIFQFLVHLSYSKQHSKSIIGVPKIIQLCDGLFASGQPPLTHCIPALQPIVEDIFLTRNKSNTTDMKELETTREVVLFLLLKLAEYHEVIDLLVLILEDSRYCSDDPEKWVRWSAQIANSVLPMLQQNKLRLESSEAFTSMRKLIFSLNPNVFLPVDNVILMLFNEPLSLEGHCRWLSKIIIILLVLSPMKEDILISKIYDLKVNFSPNSIFENVITTADPLNVTNSADLFEGLSPELIFIKFIFRVVDITSKECLAIVKNEKSDFLVNQFSKFLMYCLHIFQSGTHCKITNVAIEIINQSIPFKDDANRLESINETFLKLSVFYPTLTFQWCYLLTLWNFKDTSFWSKVLIMKEKCDILQNNCLNNEITKTGAVIVFCDYLIENLAESSQLNWNLNNNIKLIINLYNESPVTEFIYSLHRSASTSGLLIKAISNECENIKNPTSISTLLKCLNSAHPSQCGKVLHLLLMKVLFHPEVTITRNVAYMASRKIDVLLTMNVNEVNTQLPKEHLLEMKRFLVSNNLVKKHEALVSLLNKLSTQFYDLSPIEFDQRREVRPENIKMLQSDKKWFLAQIRGRYNETKLGRETAELLNNLDYFELVSFMSSSDFNKMYIKDCIQLAVGDIKQNKLNEEPAILQGSIDCLLKDVATIRSRLPKPHQVYNPVDRAATSSEVTYFNQMTELFKNQDFSSLLFSITPSISIYIKSLPIFPRIKIPDSSFEDIVKFGVISLESINFLINNKKSGLNVSLIDSAVICTELIFKESHLCGILALESHISWLCSAINSIYKLVDFLLENDEPLPSIPKYNLKLALDNIESSSAGQACYQLYILVSWLDIIKKSAVNIPKFLLNNIKSIIVSLSRMPVVNTYILIPTRVWKTGWQPEMSGVFNTQVPPLPIELLQEIDILEEYIFRITLLGWTSRQQFEETWMCLLSVCNPLDNCNAEEVNDIVHGTSLAIKAITSLLLKTLYFPTPGNVFESELIHVSRNTVISDKTTSIKKLKNIHYSMQQKYHELSSSCDGLGFVNVFEQRNFEKLNNIYSYCQMSVRYFSIANNIIEECDENDVAARVYRKRTKTLEEHGLDLTSCLQFLLDYYSQIMKAEVLSHIRVLYEAVRSTVIISDLFTEKSQFSWMMGTFLELSKTHIIEDDLLHQYLIVGICKSASVLIPDLEVFESIKKLLVQYLKSPFVTSRTACLTGILYILEGCKLNNISIGGISDEMQLILPCVVEYIQFNLNTNNNVLRKSHDHMYLVWSIAFYLIENIDEMHMETNFVINTLQTALTVIQDKKIGRLGNSIVKGLERLIIVKKEIMIKIGKQILKLALDNMKHDNPSKAFLGTQLLITYMYTDCSDHLDNATRSEDNQTSPDHLVQTIEKISAIFERIKKGYDFEAEVLTFVLPTILDDFFAPSDILTKVIGEFLSPQQPHPRLLSRVVFEVFGSAIEREQLSLLQDWVVFSLSNFTQSFSIGLATWCLTCFFISASTNKWLRSVFPYVQTRVGRYEYEDRKMLCIAGSDFYKNLTNEKQKETFIDNFRKVKDKPDMPYNDLLNSL